jgi:vancomycin resistance protein YoaR
VVSRQSPSTGVNNRTNPSRRLWSHLVLAVSLATFLITALPAFGGAVFAGAPQLLGSWTVHFTPSSLNAFGRNIRRPADIINGTVLQPGDVFNFAQAAGPFTTSNGYSSGGAIMRGRIVTDGVVGGGLCSTATTLFNAAARSGLKINARANHTFYISRYPVGLDATIWVNRRNEGKNLVFTNDTHNPITIKGFSGRRFVTFEIWGINAVRTTSFSAPVVTNRRAPTGSVWYYSDAVEPGRHKRIASPADGFDSTVVRTVRDGDGLVILRDTFRSHYRAQQGLVLLGRQPGDPPDGTRVTNPPTP